MAKVKRIVTHPSWDLYDKGTVLEVEDKQLVKGSRLLNFTKPYIEPDEVVAIPSEEESKPDNKKGQKGPGK